MLSTGLIKPTTSLLFKIFIRLFNPIGCVSELKSSLDLIIIPLTLLHTTWGGHHPLFTLNDSNLDWDGVMWLKTF